MALMRVKNLSFETRLKPLSIEVQPGEVLGLIGPNGSGKTSLIECLAGLRAYSGDIEFDGRNLRDIPPQALARAIGLLPQINASAWSLRVFDIVRLGRLPWGDEDPTAIEHAMTVTGINTLAARRIDQLSGGEQARVWLARALAGAPQVLLADEPVASLDLLHQHQVSQTLRNWACSGRSVVYSLHDLSLAARYCDRLALLDRGRLAAIGTPEEVLEPERLSAIYGLSIDVRLDHDPPLVSAQPPPPRP